MGVRKICFCSAYCISDTAAMLETYDVINAQRKAAHESGILARLYRNTIRFLVTTVYKTKRKEKRKKAITSMGIW
jgi:hypothetical protein